MLSFGWNRYTYYPIRVVIAAIISEILENVKL
jgi:hypothetical protein